MNAPAKRRKSVTMYKNTSNILEHITFLYSFYDIQYQIFPTSKYQAIANKLWFYDEVNFISISRSIALSKLIYYVGYC